MVVMNFSGTFSFQSFSLLAWNFSLLVFSELARNFLQPDTPYACPWQIATAPVRLSVATRTSSHQANAQTPTGV